MNNEILPLVETKMGRAITNSRAVADYFKKRHADVLRAIDGLDCSTEFNERNFTSVKYLDGKGEERRSFDMTRDGWVFLAMGFTGPRAAAFKEAYIARFNAMEEEPRRQHRTAFFVNEEQGLRLAADEAEKRAGEPQRKRPRCALP
ncbi:Rha family transcriptional regulator [Rhizobium sp. Root1220]|uniref:Rha family transcriptional regulator n=1 Tax=Rhizobium sp. Root1220 TaxID=1736432 RepID=UPI0006F74B72|nr:Rha family transcriptional regulator [Rhizobium sp. Root1220]KQV84346.1 hypothetical protein ASC90_02155 [Rhizobium sp. Root1220]